MTRTNWLAGLVVGVAAGLLTLTVPTLGYAMLLAFGLLLIRAAPRLPAIGGLFVGLGATWLALLLRSTLACNAFDAAPGQECRAPDLGPWLAGGVLLLAIGIVASARSGDGHAR